MKKVLIFVIALIMPVIVFGQTCDTERDPATGNNRSITCDAENSVVTNFKTTSEVTAIDNGVCTIKCTEELALSIDPIKKVLAGMSFSYPLYVSGERKCTATYDYVTYNKKIKDLIKEYESLSGAAKTTKGNELTNYYALRKQCDNFTVKGSDEFNEYKLDAKVKLDVETSTGVDKDIKYKFESLLDYTNTVTQDDVVYDNCQYNETTRKCTETGRTITGWQETARVIGKYAMENRYLEKYTGKVLDKPAANTCDAEDRYFVGLNELTKPLTGDTRNQGYKLTLYAESLGDNLMRKNAPHYDRSTWKLTATCYYQVKNFMYPQQESSTGRCIDEMCNEIGTIGYMYRIIDLNDPFPDREPGANWKGKETIISSTKDRITSLERFRINLNRNSIKRVRDYNAAQGTNGYTTFDLTDMEKSKFIISNTSIITRK